jgi:hypothetical protein
MAKKKKDRVTVTSALHVPNVTQLAIKGGDGLPDYKRYYTCEHFRFFFEPKKSKSENISGRINIGLRDNTFKIFSDGKVIIGLEIAETFCRLLIEYFNIEKPRTPKYINYPCEALFKYLAQLEKSPTTFEEITFSMYVGFIHSSSSVISTNARKRFLKILTLHPLSKSFDFSSIWFSEEQQIPIQELDFDTLFDEKDYSDRVMMQMLACCFYELEIWKKRYELMLITTKESLGENYIERYSSKDTMLKGLLTSGKDGHDKLFLNFLLEVKQERAGAKIKHRCSQSDLIRKVTERDDYIELGGLSLFTNYSRYLADKMWIYHAKSKLPKYNNYLSFKTDNMAVILALYMMISTGNNQESIVSIKRNYRNKSWYENFDVNLGVDETTPTAQKEIRVVGYKSRGVTSSKPIPMRIPINSPIFEYMKLYDDIVNDPGRDNFFTIDINSIGKFYNRFCASFEMIDDDDIPLTSIQTGRLRKTFAGHLLMELLEDVESIEDLINKLREALNHKKFDTTLFSYLMKTGMGNQVINAATIALTTNMLKKAMAFRGKVCEDTERSTTNKEVYLCDCTDDTRPTHNIPIAERCKKYDMCLGCERSEVYAAHLPSICYRIMQYNEMAIKNPLTFSGLLEDRRQIALDTINRFGDEHGRGIEVVEHAYYEATKAMKDGIPLLPAIIQFQ